MKDDGVVEGNKENLKLTDKGKDIAVKLIIAQEDIYSLFKKE